MSGDASLSLLQDLVAKAKAAGADAADAIRLESRSLSVERRLREPEAIERSEDNDIGLRVLIGGRQACVSSTDDGPAALAELVERAVAMAKVAPDDPYAGLADPDQISTTVPDIDMFDPDEPSAEKLSDLANEAEDAALSVEGVTNSDGASAFWGLTAVALAASNGFTGVYKRTSHGVSAVMLAGSGQDMQRDYDYTSTVFGADLESPAAIGRRAGERAVRRLNPRRADSRMVPVVYDPRVSRSIVGHLASAVSGSSVARGTSFLKDRMDEEIMSPAITIVDDPLIKRGLRSRPFDAEGLATVKRDMVSAGVLKSWVLDLATGRQLGLPSTGHAGRGTGGPPSPSPSNLFMVPGAQSPEELVGEIEDGLYVTELMGSSVSIVTGDYSRGAGGFWIENGQITYPVSEITVAGNLKDMFMAITPASDLVRKYGTDAPTLRIDGMTVAGPGS